MKISCQKCGAPYDIDDTLVGPSEIVIKCKKCGEFFSVVHSRKKDDISTAGWMVRKRNGSLFKIDRLSTLHKLILDGTISLKDEISRAGKSWIKLIDVDELAGLFKLASLKRQARESKIMEMPTMDIATMEISTPPSEQDMRDEAETREMPTARMQPGASDTAETTVLPRELTRVRDPEKAETLEMRTKQLKAAGITAGKPKAGTLEKESPESDDQALPYLGDREKAGRPAAGKRAVIIAASMIVILPLLYLVFHYRHAFFSGRENQSREGQKSDELKKALEVSPPLVEEKQAGAEEEAGEETGRQPQEADEASEEAGLDQEAGEEEAEEKAPLKKGIIKVQSYYYYYKTAVKLQKSGNNTKAIEFYKKALILNSHSVDALIGIARCYDSIGRRNDAAESYKTALSYNANYGPALFGLAEVYRKQGKSSLAVKYYEKYLDVNPSGSKAESARKNIEALQKENL